MSLSAGTATLAGDINVDFLSGAFALGDITLVSTSNALVIPGGIGALNLTVTGATGLSLALSGDGTDLLLTGGTGIPGDFNSDGVVDALDFLEWQRNPGIGNLSDWETNYGMPITATTTTVPEPGSVLLLFASAAMLGLTRGSRRQN